MQILNWILALVVSYLIGSIPTAYLFGRWFKQIDIREHGSGNVGATNAFRVLGKWIGTAVLILDASKGFIATVLIANIFGLNSEMGRIATAFASVAGHNWTVFLHFKGGKGIATSLGVLIGFATVFPALRMVLAITVASWIISFIIFGFVSLSSILASVVLPISIVIYTESLAMIMLGIIFCLFVVVRHKSNISRLKSGQESRVNIWAKLKK